MDNYLVKNRFSDYFLTMANIKARQLTNLAVKLADRHLKNAIVRSGFKESVQNFIAHQLQIIWSAKNDSQCWQCIRNLQQEKSYLDEQDRRLTLGTAKIVTAFQLIKKNGVWGYVINGIGVMLSSIQIVAGFGVGFASAATGNVVGVAFGATLVLHGFNGMQENVENLIYGTDDAEGFLKESYIKTAKFMGFSGQTGEVAYSSMDLALSAYGLWRMSLKPDTWRLFRNINQDYVRSFKLITKTELTIELYNESLALNQFMHLKKNNSSLSKKKV